MVNKAKWSWIFYLQGGSESWFTENNVAIASLAFHPMAQLLLIATANEIHFWDWSRREPFAVVKTASEMERVRSVCLKLTESCWLKYMNNVCIVPLRSASCFVKLKKNALRNKASHEPSVQNNIIFLFVCRWVFAAIISKRNCWKVLQWLRINIVEKTIANIKNCPNFEAIWFSSMPLIGK